MRTNIVIDPDLLEAAMKAGPFKTKKDAVEAGLKLLARQAAYREILKWKGKLQWEGDESIDWTQPRPSEVTETLPVKAYRKPVPLTPAPMVQEPAPAAKRLEVPAGQKTARGARGRR